MVMCVCVDIFKVFRYLLVSVKILEAGKWLSDFQRTILVFLHLIFLLTVKKSSIKAHSLILSFDMK